MYYIAQVKTVITRRICKCRTRDCETYFNIHKSVIKWNATDRAAKWRCATARLRLIAPRLCGTEDTSRLARRIAEPGCGYIPPIARQITPPVWLSIKCIQVRYQNVQNSIG